MATQTNTKGPLRFTTNATSDQIKAAVNSAAAKYHVPQDVMWGMFYNETNLGQNITTSSTGAVGPFQFEPPTAKKYGYPLTNTPTAAQWNQQADAAAHLLSDLYHQLGGSWANALGGYYAGPGGYRTPAAQAYAQKALKNGKTVIGQGYSTAPGGSPLPAIPDVAGAITSIWTAITSPALWKRVLYFVGGGVLLFWGIKELTGAHLPERMPVPV